MNLTDLPRGAPTTTAEMATAFLVGADDDAVNEAVERIDDAIADMEHGDALVALLFVAASLLGTSDKPDLLGSIASHILSMLLVSVDAKKKAGVG